MFNHSSRAWQSTWHKEILNKNVFEWKKKKKGKKGSLFNQENRGLVFCGAFLSEFKPYFPHLLNGRNSIDFI